MSCYVLRQPLLFRKTSARQKFYGLTIREAGGGGAAHRGTNYTPVDITKYKLNRGLMIES